MAREIKKNVSLPLRRYILRSAVPCNLAANLVTFYKRETRDALMSL